MRDESTKQAAQEYLAAKLTEEDLIYEEKHNMAMAVAGSPLVWKGVKDAIFEKCREWNAVTQEETLTCKETAMGDIRVWCSGRSERSLGSKRAASKHRYVNCGRASRSDRIEPSKGHLATETHHTFRTPRSHRAAVHHAVAPGETEPRCKVPVNLATIRSTERT